MTQKWSKIRLGDICQTNQSTYSLSEKWDYVNYLDTGNLTQDQVTEYQHIVLGVDKLPSRARRKVKPNDILYSTVRPNQLHYGIVKNLLPNTLVSTGFAVISVDEEKANSDFVYYYLTQNDVTETLQAIGEQSTSAYPSIKPSDIEKLELNLPILDEQEGIAKTLRSLDEKIEINRQINHHLSVIVQAIFNSWFVDYVPFGGTLPSEWKEVDFDEISTVQNGYAFKSKDYVSDGVRMIRTTNFDNGYVNNNDLIMLPSEFYNDAKYRNFVLNKFDTVLVMVGASVGKISLITELNTPSLQNQNMWRFRSIIPEIPESFIHFNVKRINDQVRGWSSGSARDFYRKDIFKKAKVYLPTSQVLDDFSKITMPIFEQISNNILENDKLIKARDSLLPKLMSGEVSVTD